MYHITCSFMVVLLTCVRWSGVKLKYIGGLKRGSQRTGEEMNWSGETSTARTFF